MRGLFVTGTGTEVGKSVVAAAICSGLMRCGEHVRAFKPVVTGLDDPPGPFGRDHELLASITGQDPSEVTPHCFGPAASPHLASGKALERTSLQPPDGEGVLVCEGVGGLLVPLTPDYLVRDLAVDLGLPLVVAARPGLGTINHTLLTLEAARAAGLHVAAVVMTPWPPRPAEIQRSNRATVERLGGVPVALLPETTPDGIAAAADSLPLGDWVR